MSYASKRPSISRKRRGIIFAAHGGVCWLCKAKIMDGEYDIDHQLARELGGSDLDDNLAPVHRDCHKEKSKRDVKMIAKSNRIIRNADPETRRQSKNPIRSRKAAWPKRAF